MHFEKRRRHEIKGQGREGGKQGVAEGQKLHRRVFPSPTSKLKWSDLQKFMPLFEVKSITKSLLNWALRKYLVLMEYCTGTGSGTGTHKLYWHVTHLQSQLPKQYLKDL